jgi:predicted GIY-YIG superfamily endonuclease
MTFWTYMLECFKDGESRCYYTGQSGNLYKCVGQHIDNARRGTAETFAGRFDFVRLVWAKQSTTRAEAIDRECTIKRLSYRDQRAITGRKRRA